MFISLSKYFVQVSRGQCILAVTGGVEVFAKIQNILHCMCFLSSELSCIIGRISTNIGDKLGSKVADLAKYVHLQEVEHFKLLFRSQNLHQNNENIFKQIPITFLQKRFRKKGSIGPLLFI